MKKSLIALCALALAATCFNAQAGKTPLTSGDAPPAACVPGSLKVATGKKGKGYSNSIKDIKAVCDDVVPLCEVNSGGGLDNLDILSNKKADIAPAQLDTLLKMAPGNESVKALLQVMPLNYNYLHILATKAGFLVPGEKKFGGLMDGDKVTVRVTKLSELKDRKVGVVGSATLLGPVLNGLLKGYNMQFIEYKTEAEAQNALSKAQVAAVFSVNGIPNDPIASLPQSAGFLLVKFDEEIAPPYFIRKINYKNLGVESYNIPALAVQNVLLTRDFGPEKAGQVDKLRQCVISHLRAFRDGEYEPSWDEVDPKGRADWPMMRAQESAAPAAPAKRR